MEKKSIRVAVYLTPTKHKELKIYCTHRELSMTKFIDFAIKEKLDRDIIKEKEK